MAGTGNSKTSPEQIAVDEKQIKALELRKAGVSLRQIAEELGYASPSGAHEAIKAALGKARAEPAQDLRNLMAARLDEMLVATYENALQGDVDSIAAVLRIEERRARLFGIDRREAPINIKLPKMMEAADALRVVGDLLEKTANGEILPDEASRLAGLVQSFTKIAETTELAERVKALEKKVNGDGKG